MTNNLVNSESQNQLSSQAHQLKSRWQSVLSMAKTVGGTRLGKQLAKRWKGRVALSLAGIVTVAAPAQALNFNITYAPGTTQQQIEGVELAAGLWSSYLKDDITVNFHFQMTDGSLGTALAGATPGIQRNINYFNFQTSALAEAKAANQSLFLPQSQSFSQLLQDGTVNNSSKIMLTSANAKALGLNTSTNSKLDGYLQVSSSANWNYSYDSQTINKNKYDFVSVVLHEMGHNLGFISGLDATDNSAKNQNQATALDLFRYSTESAAKGAIDSTIGNNPYFSLNGGQTAFSIDLNKNQIIESGEQAYFAQGEDRSLGGDGFQTGHWKPSANNIIGIMDPLISKGKVRSVSQLDMSLFDAIGWDINSAAQTNITLLKSQAKAKAKNAVIVERSSEVEEMMQESGVYNIASSRGSGWWQKANTAEASPNNSVSVPEPNSTMGLFALAGMVGMGAMFKRR
ncbi:NF038122 family metalloprotease [Gloeothece verrucosa]|uniref:Ice-binding protein C-terminal domain-containing protein n=1 Tax=Gloeothece verrucosa (strain PCC 7822) TaxID=497965 RepID=E0UG35_GLOV7|nr:NF038122 family metalloprotease [Gloeothece verrucosa]ADN15536.1 protein of unknown function DUF1555 [Gloeothece verrucosa PCC 7822]